jgi:hypothetical protein
LATLHLEAEAHMEGAIWTADRLLQLPTKMKILMLRIANWPAAFIAQKRLHRLSTNWRWDRILARRTQATLCLFLQLS